MCEDMWPIEREVDARAGLRGRVEECEGLVVNVLRMDPLREDFDGGGWGALSGS